MAKKDYESIAKVIKKSVITIAPTYYDGELVRSRIALELSKVFATDESFDPERFIRSCGL